MSKIFFVFSVLWHIDRMINCLHSCIMCVIQHQLKQFWAGVALLIMVLREKTIGRRLSCTKNDRRTCSHVLWTRWIIANICKEGCITGKRRCAHELSSSRRTEQCFNNSICITRNLLKVSMHTICYLQESGSHYNK